MKLGLFTHIGTPETAAGKHFFTANGLTLEKRTIGQLTHSKYDTLDVPTLSDLRGILDQAGADQHLTQGVSIHAQAIVRPKAYDGDTCTETGLPIISRTNGDLTFQEGAGLMVIDSDGDGTPMSFDSVWMALAKAQPDLASYAALQATSSSSNVVLNGTDTGVRGLHTYFHVLDAGDIPRTLEALHIRMCLTGSSAHKVSRSGAFIPRSFVDQQLAVPSQPIYIRAHVTAPVTQVKEYLLRVGAEMIDTRAVVPDLSDVEREQYATHLKDERARLAPEMADLRSEWIEETGRKVSEKTGVSIESARETVTHALCGLLTKDITIYTVQGEVTVGDILANPAAWHGVQCCDPLDPESDRNTVAKIYSDQAVPLIKSFRSGGAEYRLSLFPPVAVAVSDAAVSPLPVSVPQIDYIRDRESGKTIQNMTNVTLMLTADPRWAKTFAYDTFTHKPMTMKPIQGSAAVGTYPRPTTDGDYLIVLQWIQRFMFPKASKEMVTDAVMTAMSVTEYDSLRKYLTELPVVESTGLLDNWLFDYMGVVRTEDAMHDGYVRAIGKCWLIGAVARGMTLDGCHMQNALVLEGSQGIGKSRGIAALLPHSTWFGDDLPDFTSKDASVYMSGKWVIELAELTSIIKSKVEDMRRFVSRKTEDFRPPYGRLNIVVPRRCVLIGSTNSDDYLRDIQGERRIWPVQCTGRIDVDGLAAKRDAIWREAKDAYDAGVSWHLDPIFESYATQQQQKRVADEPWKDTIVNYVDGMSEVSPENIYNILGLSSDKWNQGFSKRITTVLKSLGYVSAGQFTRGPLRKYTRYVLGK
ncbi:VapE domain-containing protein [Falsihalocynthiibacter sp. CO-5D18]|uniref:VapE domain-containing protein n=1 Tax=Falsihalocynthiibacter sp. CO-5D18 TaxID=3240872 RepID=UPI00350F4B16